MVNVLRSKFHFVDLAGSERQKSTLSMGDRLKEAGNINKSLLVLGQVINSLVEASEGKQRHVRYRDSKLTFMLRDSLGGNAKTCLIANVSPASSSFSETLSTLKFAQRAKQIKNKALINADSSGSVEALKMEIKRLRDELVQSQLTVDVLESKQMDVENSALTAPFSMNLDPNNEMHKALLELNHHSIQVESLLKQNIEVLTSNELCLQVEIAKREDYVNTFQSAVDFYEMNELQYRSVMALYEEKMMKYNRIARQKSIEGVDVDGMLLEQNSDLIKEKACLLEVIKNTPLIMGVFKENIEMRLKAEAVEGDTNPTSTISISKQLIENAILLKETIAKIDVDMLY